MIVVAALAAIAAVAFLVVVLVRRRSREPDGWSAGPTIARLNYSAGVVVGADGSFAFPTAAPGVHYVTRGCRPGEFKGAKRVRLRYRMDAAAGSTFHPVKSPGSPSIGPTLYLQRRGDDWSGKGEREAYRWFATFAAVCPMVPGEFEMIAGLDQRWTAVETSDALTAPAAFAAALDDAERVGFVFGGGDGFGHGLYGDDPAARFVVLGFFIE